MSTGTISKRVNSHLEERQAIVTKLNVLLSDFALTAFDFPIASSEYTSEGFYQYVFTRKGHPIWRNGERVKVWTLWGDKFPVDEFHALANAIRRHDGEEEYVDF